MLVLLQQAVHGRLLAINVCLDLVDRGNDLAMGNQIQVVLLHEVGNTY